MDNESLEPITRKEHNSDASAKRAILRGQDPGTGNWVNISAFDNGDGTYSLRTAINPGVTATSLGKSKGSIVGASDTGIATLAKVNSDVSASEVDDGDYDTFSLTQWKEMRVRDQRSKDLQSCNDHTQVTVLGNDTTNLATTTNHVFGTGAISFDKVNGAANTVFAGVAAATVDIWINYYQ